MNKLFSENHTEDDCDSIDKQAVIYNLYEDIRCLKERVNELEGSLLGAADKMISHSLRDKYIRAAKGEQE